MDGLWILATDFHYDFTGTGKFLFGVLALVGMSWLINRHSTIPWIRRVTSVLIWVGVFASFTVVGAPASYLFASVGGSFKDAWFASADQALGLDWVALLTFFSSHAWLGEYSSRIYTSSATTLVVILLYLSLFNKHKQGDLLLASAIIAGFLTALLSAPLAAYGPFNFYHVSASLYKDFAPAVTGEGGGWLTDLLHLRDGSLRELGAGKYQGIVQFPSFHTALSVVMILSLRGTGPAFVLGGLWNLLILMTVPIDGGHYFVDMIAGALIAVSVWYGLAALDRMVSEGHRFSLSGFVVGPKVLSARIRMVLAGLPARARAAGGLLLAMLACVRP